MQRSEAGRQRTMTDGPPQETVSPKPIRIAVSGLTPGETEVVRWVARGLTNKSIASQLHVSSRTVQKHMERMLKNLGVRSRAGLVA